MNFCLPPDEAEKFKRKLRAGDIDLHKLSEMTSAQRRDLFAEHFGKDIAQEMNVLLEQKLLLKNQKAGIVAWAKKMMAAPKYEAQRNDIIKRVQGIDSLLNPKDETAFLQDLAAEKLGMNVSYAEMQQIAEMAKRIAETKAAMEAAPRRKDTVLDPPTPEEFAYGWEVTGLRNYVDELTMDAKKLRLADFKTNPVRSSVKALGIAAGVPKAMVSGLDVSYLGRQGFKTLINNPGMWKRNALKSFRAGAAGFKSNSADAVMRQVNASIVSSPDYPDMVRGNLALQVHEEAYPSSLPQKIPGLGRVYSFSDASFTAFNQLNRANTFSLLLGKARKLGIEITNDELKALGRFAGSMTARGHLGSMEDKVGLLNSLFFSPRNAKATVDLFLHAFTGAGGRSGQGSAFVRREAQIALAKYVAFVALLLLLARGLLGEEGVDFDFRGTDAGKIKIRKDSLTNKVAGMVASIVGVGIDTREDSKFTRYEVTASAAGYVTLLTRMALHTYNGLIGISGAPKRYKIESTKTSGKTKFISKGNYGLPMVMLDFAENKASPVAAALNEDFIMQQTRDREDPSLGSNFKTLFEPMVFREFEDLTGIGK